MTQKAGPEKLQAKQNSKSSRKQHILKAAAEAFALYGYSVSIEQIAEKIGVTKGHIYYYFDSKQEMLYEIFKGAMELFLKKATSVANGDLTVEKRLQVVLESHVLALCENIHIMTVFMDLYRELSSEHSKEIINSRKQYEHFLQDMLREGVEKGYFLDKNVKLLSYAILGSINWVYMWYRQEGILSKEKIAEEISSYLVKGLLKEVPQRPAKMGRSIQSISVGEKASLSRTICENEIYLFAGITGDFNPLYFDEDFARRSAFERLIVPGGIIGSLADPVIGTILPGPGTVVEKISCDFSRPVFAGDTITASAEVKEKDEKSNRLLMSLSWSNQNNEQVASGQAEVLPPPAKK